jgi:hypothetical protein
MDLAERYTKLFFLTEKLIFAFKRQGWDFVAHETWAYVLLFSLPKK